MSEIVSDPDGEDHTDDSGVGMSVTSVESGIRSATMPPLITVEDASSVPVFNNDINNTTDLSWILLKLALVLTILTIGWMIWLRLSHHQLAPVHQGKWRVRCKGKRTGIKWQALKLYALAVLIRQNLGGMIISMAGLFRTSIKFKW